MQDAAIGVTRVAWMNHLQRATFLLEQHAHCIQVCRLPADARAGFLWMPVQAHDDIFQIDFPIGAYAVVYSACMTIVLHACPLLVARHFAGAGGGRRPTSTAIDSGLLSLSTPNVPRVPGASAAVSLISAPVSGMGLALGGTRAAP